jgi:hypothetical protein
LLLQQKTSVACYDLQVECDIDLVRR